MQKYMTIFYKKRNLEINGLTLGEKNLSIFGNLDIEDAEMIYGYIVVEYNEYIANNTNLFELYKNDNSDVNIRMRYDAKNNIQQFL